MAFSWKVAHWSAGASGSQLSAMAGSSSGWGVFLSIFCLTEHCWGCGAGAQRPCWKDCVVTRQWAVRVCAAHPVEAVSLAYFADFLADLNIYHILIN